MSAHSSYKHTLKPILRGHPREGQKLAAYRTTGDPLIQVNLHYILVQGAQKMRLLKTGNPLIEVTT